jgi:hypothetical protein
MWQWAGKWQDASDRDSGSKYYSFTTFHSTDVPGSNVTLPFNGTAITAYGSKWFNHDNYTANVDGQGGVFNGHSQDRLYQVPLFAASGLSATTQHELFLADSSTNKDMPWFDVDHAVITLGDGSSNTKSTDIVLDDTHSNITYSPGFVLSGGSGLSDTYYNKTFHLTNTAGASATINFWGNAIVLYGAVSSNHGPFTVSLDGAEPIELTGLSWTFRPQQILYQWSGLEYQAHTVVLTHTSKNESQYLDFDSVVVSRWGSASTDTSGVPSGTLTTDTGSMSTSASLTSSSSSTKPLSLSSILPSSTPVSSATSTTAIPANSQNAALNLRKPDANVFVSTILAVFLLVTMFGGPLCFFPHSQQRKKRSTAST